MSAKPRARDAAPLEIGEALALCQRGRRGDAEAVAALYYAYAHLLDREWTRRAAGWSRSAQRARSARAWMQPYFERAYAELRAEGYRRIGRGRLESRAYHLAIDEPRRGEITERAARAFLEGRRAR